MALNEADIDESFIASARAIVVTGTHFSTANAAAAQKKAIRLAKAAGGKVVFDIDYRPNLWGLAGHAAGFERYVASDRVTREYQSVLPDTDLVVGTEEEIAIAAGTSDLPSALKTIRQLTNATIVLKRGAKGCIVYDGAIPDDLEQGIVGKGFPIEIYNVLGAGDAFMSGFLRGWLKGEPHSTSATWANACGAFAVSRLLCAPEYPTWEELSFFLKNGSKEKALRKDEALNHLHWATTRRTDWPQLMALAIDHRSQLEDLPGATAEKLGAFKRLAVKAAARVAKGRHGYGMLLDDRYGRDALFDAGEEGNLWIAKPIEQPGSRPLRFEFNQDLGSRLIDWPVDHCIKVLCFFHPDDPPTLKREQIEKLRQAYDAARKVGRELLIEIIASKNGTLGDTTVSSVLGELYDAGMKPDWWKLEPQVSRRAWEEIDRVIETRDPYCRGVVLLGLDSPQDVLEQGFAAAKSARTVKGFAVGRTIFGDAARAWLSGSMNDEQAIADMARRFEQLTDVWQRLGATAAA
jgi:5-dehydro-2-deoxygluconokinase